MLQTDQIFHPSIQSNLYSFQLDKITRQVNDYILCNKEAEKHHFELCPKCGAKHPHLTKAGHTAAGKQMLKCHECNKRFVVDHGELTYYSHQGQAKWDDLIIKTQQGASIKDTASSIDVHETTAFRMRHKYLRFLEHQEQHYVLKEEVELDEKFFPYSHKGTKIASVIGKKRGTAASKRGTSNEQVCLLTGVQRLGNTIAKAFNLAKPTSMDILNLKDSIQQESFVWTDGLASYNVLIEENHCSHKIVKTKNEYDKVNHLNNINSFHQRIETQYERYRGVASKYINRYAALFTMQSECRDMDPTECLLYIKRRLKKIKVYFYVREIANTDIFTPKPGIFA